MVPNNGKRSCGAISAEFSWNLEMTEKIGEFLYRVVVMEPWQVKKVLQAQNAGGNRFFGEIALDFGYIKDDVIKRYVD